MKTYFRRGQGLVEYVLIIGLIACISIVAVKSLGKTISTKMANTTTEMNMSYADSDSETSTIGGHI